MNIAIVCYPTFGGSGVVATELGVALAHKGHQVHFITYGQPVRLSVFHKNIYFHQVYMEEYPLFRYQPYELALSSKMVEVVREYRIDVIHAHYAIPYAYAAFMAKQMLKEKGKDLPLITTLHGTDITLVGQHPSYKHAVEFSINQSDALTSVSESLKQDTLSFFEVRKEINVIPNFIDDRHFEQCITCSRKQFAEDDERVLVHISNLRPVKRIQDVLEVFKRVNEKVPSKLIIVGEGPEMERVDSFLVDYPDFMDKIKIMGKQNDLRAVLTHADVFLLPSEKESFGLAALEAMAAATPVISSNTGGIPEVNIHGKTGFLADVGDVEKMAEYGVKLLSDENLLKEMKKIAKEVAKTFDYKRVIPMYENLYHQVVENFRK